MRRTERLPDRRRARSLGPLGSRYRVDPTATAILTAKFDDFTRRASEFNEMWPMSPEDPLQFLCAVGDFYTTARSMLCTSGEKVSNARCGRQRFIRWAVASLDRFELKVFNGVTYDHIETLLPEEQIM